MFGFGFYSPLEAAAFIVFPVTVGVCFLVFASPPSYRKKALTFLGARPSSPAIKQTDN